MNYDPRGIVVRLSGHIFAIATLAATLAATMAASLASAASESGWTLVRQDETPRVYAITKSMRTNLNLVAVVLACERIERRNNIQLQLYPSNQEPILPAGASPEDMKDEPRAELAIDDTTYAVQVAFGGDYALVMDGVDGDLPMLSAKLLEALEAGKTLRLRFDLVREAASQPASFDGEVEIDLQAGEGTGALATVRRECLRK
jgi:hypothetical protein